MTAAGKLDPESRLFARHTNVFLCLGPTAGFILTEVYSHYNEKSFSVYLVHRDSSAHKVQTTLRGSLWVQQITADPCLDTIKN